MDDRKQKVNKSKVESNKAKMAFELYASLGDKRSLKKVAELLGLSVKTIEGYSKDFEWQKRLDEVYMPMTDTIRKKREAVILAALDAALVALEQITTKFKKGYTGIDTTKAFSQLLESTLKYTEINENLDSKSPSTCEGEGVAVDTPETKEVIEQIEKSLKSLEG